MTSTRRGFLLAAAALGGAPLAGRLGSGAMPAARAQGATPYTYRRNWGRWGKDDAMGAVNLITPQKRAQAAGLVKTGRTVSMSRVFEPDQHFMRITEREDGGGSAVDYYGFLYHGVSVTHLDALCHTWDRNGMWNGRRPADEIDTRGARFADITAFASGIVTRGVLLDVPRHRGTPYVAQDRPIEGAELEAVAKAQGVTVEPGDALLVYGGREAFVRANAPYPTSPAARPGLAPSCARFVRDRDVSLLGWDMHDAMPDKDGLPWPMHGVLYSYGVAIIDNALLEPLAAACAEERRYAFMFMALPLTIARGTGSPVNPVALF